MSRHVEGNKRYQTGKRDEPYKRGRKTQSFKRNWRSDLQQVVKSERPIEVGLY